MTKRSREEKLIDEKRREDKISPNNMTDEEKRRDETELEIK